MAHAWKACWCNSLTSSNLVFSARIGTPETVGIIRFPGFALVPSDCRFPPGSLRFDAFGPDLPRVSHIGTDDSENAFEPSPAVRSSSKSDRAPCVPSVGRFESLHVLRAVFSFWFATIPDARRAARCAPCGPAQREGPPGPPPTNATRTHTGAMKAHSNRQSTP